MKVMAMAVSALLATLATAALAQAPVRPATGANLADLSLEQLGNIMVTSVSKREEPLSAANAAIYVITAEDIRRSGATTLPEALRMAPNLDVARADTNTYAISARGFNTLTANNMLVMIDGRTIYSILFSGVFWESQHVMLEDVERIEVISGPGTTLWGANAVNGVINVITRQASDTQGVLVAGGGSDRESGGGVRYGGPMGDEGSGGHYRVYGRSIDLKNAKRQDGPAIRDASSTVQAGFRADWVRPMGGFTVQGDFYESDIDQAPRGREASGFNLLARWQHQLPGGSRMRLQGYYDRADRDIPTQYSDKIETWDLEFQCALPAGTTHTLIWGAGNRLSRDRFTNGPATGFSPANRDLLLSNVFVQDSIALSPSLALTLGAKVEHNTYTGSEFLPNARIAWRPATDWTMWAALSRALRTPSRLDRDYDTPTIVGNPDYRSEVVNVIEGGFRSRPSSAFNYSVTVYHQNHDYIRSIEATSSRFLLDNKIEGTSSGVNVWGSYQAAKNWRLSAGGAWQRIELERKPGSRDVGLGASSAGNDPRHWASLRSYWDITPQHELDVTLRRVGARPNPVVPSYTAVDVRLGWRISRSLALSLTLRNASDDEHTEWGAVTNRAVFERNAFLKLVWRP